jgi:hypothetical protein
VVEEPEHPPNGEITSAEILAVRDKEWEMIKAYAVEAQLTPAQWDRFRRDLIELAKLQDDMEWDESYERLSREEQTELIVDLGTQLEERCAAYLNQKQMRNLRRRFTLFDLVNGVHGLQLERLLEEQAEVPRQ